MRNEERFSEVVSNMIIAITSCSLYSTEHPAVAEFSIKAHALLNDLFVENSITITLLGDTFLLNDAPIADRSAHMHTLIKKLRTKGIERVVIRKGIDAGEFKSFVTALASRESVAPGPHITVGMLEVRFKAEGDFAPIMNKSISQVAEAYEGISRYRRLDVVGLEDAVIGFISALKREADVLRVLSPIKSHSTYTYVHESNVAVLTIFQAEAMGFSGEALHEIGLAGLLHDIGKLFVPHEVIDKQAQLDDSEWLIMRQHPIYGALYLSSVPEVPKLAVIAAYEHHMKYDGSGYPERKRWMKGQHLVSQMVATADFFDALRSRRSYRDTADIPQIVGLFSQAAGKDFNPVLVKNFIAALKKIKAF